MNNFLLILTLVVIGTACPKKLKCSDLQIRQDCKWAEHYGGECYWREYNKKCEASPQNFHCVYALTESQCNLSYDCFWLNNQCQKNQLENFNYRKKIVSNCHSYMTYSSCIQKTHYDFCTWEHNKCIPVTKCSEINDYMQCRKMRMIERYAISQSRCQIVVNGKLSNMEKQYFYLSDIFDDFQCRAQDCVYNYYSDCPKFKNGRRCFQYFGGCTQCSYLTSQKDCIQSNECTWQGGCRNILCSDLTTKTLCSSKPYCIFDDKNLTCETRTDGQFYCYYYDIGSEPKKYTQKEL